MENKEIACVRFEVAIALATEPSLEFAELREEILQAMCREDPMIRAIIEGFRSEHQ